MFKATIAIGMVIVGGIVVYNANQPAIVYQNTETSTSTVEAQPQYPDDWVAEAEAAKEAVLKRKELEKKDAELTEQINALKAEQADVQKELGLY